jgi:hypothetical protein
MSELDLLTIWSAVSTLKQYLETELEKVEA